MISFAKQFVVGLLVICAVGTAAAQDVESPQQILDTLSKADRARSAESQAQAAWRQESQNLKALVASLQTALKQLKDQQAKEQSALSSEEAKAKALQDKEPPREALDAALTTLADEKEAKLNAFAAKLLPGIVPAAATTKTSSPLERLQDIARRLRTTKSELSKWDVAILDGQRGGKTVAVKVLRCGGVAAWWQSLDGSAQGVAAWDGNGLTLHDASNPESAKQIETALAIIEGRRVPELITLPFDKAKRTEQSGAKP